MMRKMIPQKSELTKLFFPGGKKEVFQENISEELIVRTFCVREPSLDEGQLFFMEKMPVEIVRDLSSVNETFMSYLEGVNASRLRHLEESVRGCVGECGRF